MTGLEHLSDARGRRIRALQERKMREKYGQFLAEGVTLVEEAVRSSMTVEFVCGDHSQLPFLEQLALAGSFPVYHVSEESFLALSTTESPQGVLAVMKMPEISTDAGALLGHDWKTCIALDHVSDPGNVGTAIRSADWFGASAVIIGPGSVDVYNPKVVRGSMGSLFHLPVVQVENLALWLVEAEAAGARIIGTALHGNPIVRHELEGAKVIVIGSEGRGMWPEVASVCSVIVTIPRFGNAESLNAGISAAIILAALRGIADC
jgi:TrmH family RNA methyltransferase